MTMALTQQKITEFTFRPTSGPGAGATPGTRPLTQAPAGSTVQGLADSQGKGDNWQDIAAANNIENPRMLQPGQLLDMNASVGVSIGVGGSVSAGASVSVGATSQVGVSLETGAGIQTGVSISGGASIGVG